MIIYRIHSGYTEARLQPITSKKNNHHTNRCTVNVNKTNLQTYVPGGHSATVEYVGEAGVVKGDGRGELHAPLI